MEHLNINTFNGASTVKNNSERPRNSVFISEVKKFEGELSRCFYNLKVPLTGQECYYINGTKNTVNNDSFLLLNPDNELYAKVDSKETVRGLCIAFEKSFIRKLANTLDCEKTIDITESENEEADGIHFLEHTYRINNDQLSSTIKKIKKLFFSKNFGVSSIESEMFFYDLGEIILCHQNETFNKLNRLDLVRKAYKEELYKRLDVMNNFIHDMFLNDISLDDIARASNLSKFHAIRSYQKIFRCSPYQKIIQLRLLKSKELLKEGIKIIEVADMVNFSDRRSFSKAFKNNFGYSPSEFSTTT